MHDPWPLSRRSDGLQVQHHLPKRLASLQSAGVVQTLRHSLLPALPGLHGSFMGQQQPAELGTIGLVSVHQLAQGRHPSGALISGARRLHHQIESEGRQAATLLWAEGLPALPAHQRLIRARHRTSGRAELLRQWQERLQAFLDVAPEAIGCIGGGKAKPTGQLDIAVMQSLVRKGEVNPVVQGYGQVIVDECHHIAAASFETILRQVRARHVLGLSATLVRRDGLQPILFMQCGPIRHTAQRPAGAPQILELVSRSHQLPALPADLPIQELMRRLAEDQPRTDRIVAEALHCWGDGRKLLLLSERTDHITAIAGALAEQVPNLFLLHGRLSARQRSATLAALEQLPPEAPRIVLATGRLVGEGFDHPPLDTLLLAMPVSWKGTLQQYAGRLHRQQSGKTSVRIIDCLDLGHPVPQRMCERRLRGYRAMGYELTSTQQPPSGGGHVRPPPVQYGPAHQALGEGQY